MSQYKYLHDKKLILIHIELIIYGISLIIYMTLENITPHISLADVSDGTFCYQLPQYQYGSVMKWKCNLPKFDESNKDQVLAEYYKKINSKPLNKSEMKIFKKCNLLCNDKFLGAEVLNLQNLLNYENCVSNCVYKIGKKPKYIK